MLSREMKAGRHLLIGAVVWAVVGAGCLKLLLREDEQGEARATPARFVICRPPPECLAAQSPPRDVPPCVDRYVCTLEPR
jgi:hypothetical protein